MERFYPDKYLAQVLPDGFTEKGLLFDNLNPRKTYLRALLQAAGRNGKELKSSVYETINQYVKKEAELKAAGVEAFKEEAVNDQTLLTQRIENFLVWNKVQEEKESHKGQPYRWLPSDAKNPDPQHQLNYGKIFFEGDGQEMPGERYGCRCGIEWLEAGDMTIEDKLSAVDVKLGQETHLPPLNQADLEQMGLKKSKPVIWTKYSNSRSAGKHKDITAQEYNYLIGNSLYKHKYPVFRDRKNTNYWHFIGTPETGRTSAPVVLLDVEETKSAFEIVHVHRMEANSLRRLLRKIQKKN